MLHFGSEAFDVDPALHKKRSRIVHAINTPGVDLDVLEQAFQSGADIRRLLQLSIVAMVFWMSGLAFVIVIQLSTMTKRILRAIELATRK